METKTFGTQLFSIPGLKWLFTLEIIQSRDGSISLFCPYFEECGTGQDFDSALADLSSSLIDLMASLSKHKHLSNHDKEILARLKEYML